MYKVGDKIKIKQVYDSSKMDSGFTPFYNINMRQYCGKEAIITRIYPVTGEYQLDIDNGKYYWNNRMFE